MINKPINPYPYNCYVENNSEWAIEYEIPNNQKIDGRYIQIDNIETGKTLLYNNKNLDLPTSHISWNIDTQLSDSGNGEYSWSSLYWQTPTQNADEFTILDCDLENNKLFLKPENYSGDYITTEYEWVQSPLDFYIATNMIDYLDGTGDTGGKEYSKLTQDLLCIDYGEDTSWCCSTGQLQDYFGYNAFRICFKDPTNYHDTIVNKIGLGKCVVNVFDRGGSLVTCAKILAYHSIDSKKVPSGSSYQHVYIVDNPRFWGQIEKAMSENRLSREFYCRNTSNRYEDARFLSTSGFEFCNIDEIKGDKNISGLVDYRGNKYFIKNFGFSDYRYAITLFPKVNQDMVVNGTISVWDNSRANFNTTPPYYFRIKTPPEVSVSVDNSMTITDSNGNYINTIHDAKGNFGIDYTSSLCGINYFYLHLFVYDKGSAKWILQERSPIYYDTEETHGFVGFVNGQKYRIQGVCVDNDGDEWTTDDIIFDCTYSPVISKEVIATFSKKSSTVDISFASIIAPYTDVHVEFYRIIQDNTSAVNYITYAGGGICKISDVVTFNCWHDYNIKNDTIYDYYIRLTFTEGGVEKKLWYQVESKIHTDFYGTSILGLNVSKGTELAIVHNFNLFYRFDSEMGELTNEISRDYINTFGRYPKELKGFQNYLSGQFSGLLGSETNGIYTEPKEIRSQWNSFVDDDSIKLYRGVDGETMIVSIDTSKIKPYYYPNVGLVNEVTFTFKELSPTNGYAIFSTEKIGG